MPWISRKPYELLVQALHEVGKSNLDLRAERDRLIGELKTWSTRGRVTEEALARAQAEIKSMYDRVNLAERQRAAAQASEGVFRTELNTIRLERATLLAKLIGADIKVPTFEAPIGMEASEGGGVSFEDLGDAAAAVAGYKDMHDIPASRPAAPEETNL